MGAAGLGVGLVLMCAPAASAATGRIEVTVRGLPEGTDPDPSAQVYRSAPVQIRTLDRHGRTTVVRAARVGTWNLIAQNVRVTRSGGGAKRGDVFVPRLPGRFSVRSGQTTRVTLRFRRFRFRPPLTGVTQVSVSKSYDNDLACAVARGAAACWGLGFGTRQNGFSTKAATFVDSGVTQVSTGDHHACAVVEASAMCWGANPDGELGSTDRRERGPVIVLSSGVAAVSAGLAQSCALLFDGSVRCWGSNDYGALGVAGVERSASPVTAVASGALGVATEGSTSCALFAGGEVRCWGHWGNSDEDDHPNPFTVVSSGASSLSGGPCALFGGRLSCLGWIPGGQRNRGGTRFRHSGTPVDTGLGAVEQGESSRGVPACGVAGRSVRCVGFSAPLSRRLKTYIASSATQVSVGDRGACAVVADRVKCWGPEGLVGDGTFTASSFPVAVRK